MAKLLQESLGLDTAPALDRAHCSLQPEPARGQQGFHRKVSLLPREAGSAPESGEGEPTDLQWRQDHDFLGPAALGCETQIRFQRSKGASPPLPGCAIWNALSSKTQVSSSRGENIFTDSAATRDYVMKNFLPDQDHTADS